jgi:hypothetical protein
MTSPQREFIKLMHKAIDTAAKASERSYLLEIKAQEVKESAIKEICTTYRHYAKSANANDYDPMALKSLAMGAAKIIESPAQRITSEAKKVVDELGGAEPTQESSELDERIKTAIDQGMRWNDANKKPSKKTTVLRKLEEWETEYENGLNIDLSTYCVPCYSELSCLAFATGLTIAIEKLNKIEKKHAYAVPRYDYAKKIHLANQIPIEQHAKAIHKILFDKKLRDCASEVTLQSIETKLSKLDSIFDIDTEVIRGTYRYLVRTYGAQDSEFHQFCTDVRGGKKDDYLQRVLDDYLESLRR